jgi:hypothetical protein
MLTRQIRISRSIYRHSYQFFSTEVVGNTPKTENNETKTENIIGRFYQELVFRYRQVIKCIKLKVNTYCSYLLIIEKYSCTITIEKTFSYVSK